MIKDNNKIFSDFNLSIKETPIEKKRPTKIIEEKQTT